MKTFKVFSFILLFFFAQTAFAQTKKETIKVNGECGMCKKKIESAAKSAGATYAVWNTNSKQLVVKYNSTASNAAKIQQSVAAAGYDTPHYKATDEAYSNLHECCKYDRAAAAVKCCDSEKCVQCCTEGKCTKDMECCRESGCAEKTCCKKN